MSRHTSITVTKDGPYLVSGSVPVAFQIIAVNDEGESITWVESDTLQTGEHYALCRCGASSTKPFCDGAHAKIGFDGTETASRQPVMDQAEVIDGPTVQLADAEGLCAFARFCDPQGRVWNQAAATHDAKVRAQFIQQVGDCPAGRLVAIDKATGDPIEREFSQSIGIVEDPALQCSGPLWVRGAIRLIGVDGQTYELRNRMTLCRCGRSENKPFCDGAHAADPKFRDGLT
ncbi:MAG TPA: CDGSH iron-sulfur domain-containing protein [Nitrospira sp.]|nr:CDGSH iron-sulfur domain-containing protein [Nitrospira sp.]